jgi:hypothetical protein
MIRYPAYFEAVEVASIVPGQVRGAEVHGAAADWEALAPEEAEAVQVRACEGVVEAVVPVARINP